ncbi:MAG: transketolase C-terminal domain-containing protein, partial [Desulfomonilia bacterium]
VIEELFRCAACGHLPYGKDQVTIAAGGITVFEALAAFEMLKKEGILLRVIDLYSIKPLDIDTLTEAAHATKAIITVEDHYAEGGLGEAVREPCTQRRRLCISLPYGRCPQAAHRKSSSITRGFRKTASSGR